MAGSQTRDELAGEFRLVRNWCGRIRARTPARILVGRAGAAYRTETQMQLREDHAAARDAVRAEFDLNAAFGAGFVERWKLFEVRTRASSKDEYLLHPSLGRRIQRRIAGGSMRNAAREVRICRLRSATDYLFRPIGAQVPRLLPLLVRRRTGAGLERWPNICHSSLPRGDFERDWRAA